MFGVLLDRQAGNSIGAVNPALTAIANAVRVGDHLLERLGAQRHSTETSHVA